MSEIDRKNYKIALVGNPNCGKSTIFNSLTGLRQKIGNWSGVTVEKKLGNYAFDDINFEVIDLPGIYSIDYDSCIAKDETIARENILFGKYDLIINVVNASNLEKGLSLTTQLLATNKPILVLLNMIDIADKRSIHINIEQLISDLGVKVIKLNAVKDKKLVELRKTIIEEVIVKEAPSQHKKHVKYNEEIESLINNFSKNNEKSKNNEENEENRISDSRWLILQDLKRKKEISLPEYRKLLFYHYKFIKKIIQNCVIASGKNSKISDLLDKIVLNKFLAVPIFLSIMYSMFFFTISVGGAFIDFFDILFGTIFVDGSRYILSILHVPELGKILLADGLGGGIQVVATFIPIIGCLYIFLSVLEESGYMVRVSWIMNDLMGKIGLSGKAFVPLILGFGCSVPAIMGTRILSSTKDRMSVIMMTPFFSCGAKLPVYTLFAVVFFPTNGTQIVFCLYLIGIIVALITGILIKHIFYRDGKETEQLLIELPSYHFPTVRNVIINSWQRLKIFIFNAGRLIVFVVVILTFLNSIGINGSLNIEPKDSVLSKLGQKITYVLKPMGISEENWPAAVGIFTGIFAKEVLVGTLNSLYSSMVEDSAEEDESKFFDNIYQAFASIPINLYGVKDNIFNILGIELEQLKDKDLLAQEQDLSGSTMGVIKNMFVNSTSAFAYLLFILLYSPCMSALGAIYRELNLRWAIITALYSTYFAYMVSTVFYQIVTYNNHPLFTYIYISSFLSFTVILLLYIKEWYKKQPKNISFEEKLKLLPNFKCSSSKKNCKSSSCHV